MLQSLKELREKTISYRWKSDKDGLERVTYTGLISAYSDVVGTDYVDITLSKWAQPFLSYIGQYVGATYYNKVTALSLPGSYSKRMYKLCKQWERKGFIPEMSPVLT